MTTPSPLSPLPSPLEKGGVRGRALYCQRTNTHCRSTFNATLCKPMTENKRSPSRARQLTAVSAVLVGLGSLGTFPSPTAAAQKVQVRLGPIAHVSADRPGVPHAEPHLAIHPVDPDRLLAGAIVMPHGEVSVIE